MTLVIFIGFICLGPTDVKKKQHSMGSLVSSDMCSNYKENISSAFLACIFIRWNDNGPRNNPWDRKQKHPELNFPSHLFNGHRKFISTIIFHQHWRMFYFRPLCNSSQLDCFSPSSLLRVFQVKEIINAASSRKPVFSCKHYHLYFILFLLICSVYSN